MQVLLDMLSRKRHPNFLKIF